MHQPYRWGVHYSIGSLDADIGRIAQQLFQIMDVVCDVCAEVKNYRDDTQSRMQDIVYKLHMILDCCDGVSLTLNIPPPLMLEGTHSDIPILAPCGSNITMV